MFLRKILCFYGENSFLLKKGVPIGKVFHRMLNFFFNLRITEKKEEEKIYIRRDISTHQHSVYMIRQFQ
jgi:hypothetical protein